MLRGKALLAWPKERARNPLARAKADPTREP